MGRTGITRQQMALSASGLIGLTLVGLVGLWHVSHPREATPVIKPQLSESDLRMQKYLDAIEKNDP